jgi:hypothetical protein
MQVLIDGWMVDEEREREVKEESSIIRFVSFHINSILQSRPETYSLLFFSSLFW